MVTTYTYDNGIRLDYEPGSVSSAGPSITPSPTRLFTVTVTDPQGRRFTRTFEAQRDEAQTGDPSEQRDTELAALANAIDMIPLLSDRWRLTEARDTWGGRTHYQFDTTSVVSSGSRTRADGTVEEISCAAGRIG